MVGSADMEVAAASICFFSNSFVPASLMSTDHPPARIKPANLIPATSYRTLSTVSSAASSSSGVRLLSASSVISLTRPNYSLSTSHNSTFSISFIYCVVIAVTSSALIPLQLSREQHKYSLICFIASNPFCVAMTCMICADDDSTKNGPTFLKTHLGDRRLHVCDDAVHAFDSLLHLNARFALNLQHSSAGLLSLILQHLHHLLLGFPLDVQLNLLTSSLQLFHYHSTPIPTSDLMLYFTNIGFNAVLHICVLFC